MTAPSKPTNSVNIPYVIIGVLLTFIIGFLVDISKTQTVILRKISAYDIQLNYMNDDMNSVQGMSHANSQRIRDLEEGSVSATSDRFRKSDAIDMVQWIENTYIDNGIRYKPYKFRENEN